MNTFARNLKVVISTAIVTGTAYMRVELDQQNGTTAIAFALENELIYKRPPEYKPPKFNRNGKRKRNPNRWR